MSDRFRMVGDGGILFCIDVSTPFSAVVDFFDNRLLGDTQFLLLMFCFLVEGGGQGLFIFRKANIWTADRDRD